MPTPIVRPNKVLRRPFLRVSSDYAPGFRVEHTLKDLDLLYADSACIGHPTQATALTRSIFAQAARRSAGTGTQSVAGVAGPQP